MNGPFYLLKVQLLEIEPPIWRRFAVPASITLDRLGDVLQIVMGWHDLHLHEFIIGKNSYAEITENTEDELDWSKYRLGDLVKKNDASFLYIYDFGDNWQHQIILEDCNFIIPEESLAITCLEGERACPPEDVGGTHGYSEFCEIMKNPKHKQYKASKKWLGIPFDSENYDPGSVNYLLLLYFRWSRDRSLCWKTTE